MFKYAKITLLTLAVFLLLGFSVTVGAKPGNDAPPTVDVNVTNINEPVLLQVQITAYGALYVIYSDTMKELGSIEPYVVPDGKQLVIEYVAMQGLSGTPPAGNYYRGMIIVPPFSTRLAVGRVTSEGIGAGELVKIRVQEGLQVHFAIESSFGVIVNADLSGYLEDM